eukprot:TRINITY_DN9818_c1_g1_i1.p1 TRINITY_DN9818_c1_g1~~TRINITY_DN9818_c1_g1_i1.p1  ORF type:complete len:482 (-),score=55.26 TRINITY_DN9818_c1_g1_i1:75-1520(-)
MLSARLAHRWVASTLLLSFLLILLVEARKFSRGPGAANEETDELAPETDELAQIARTHLKFPIEVVRENYYASLGGKLKHVYSSKPIYDLGDPDIVQIFYDDNIVGSESDITLFSEGDRGYVSFGTCTYITKNFDSDVTPEKIVSVFTPWNASLKTYKLDNTYFVKADVRAFIPFSTSLLTTFTRIAEDLHKNVKRVIFHLDANGAVILTDSVERTLNASKMTEEVQVAARKFSQLLPDSLKDANFHALLGTAENTIQFPHMFMPFLLRVERESPLGLHSVVRTNGVEGMKAGEALLDMITRLSGDVEVNANPFVRYEMYHYIPSRGVVIVGSHLDYLHHGLGPKAKYDVVLAESERDTFLTAPSKACLSDRQFEELQTTAESFFVDYGTDKVSFNRDYILSLIQSAKDQSTPVPQEMIVRFSPCNEPADEQMKFCVGKAVCGDHDTIPWIPKGLYRFKSKGEVDVTVTTSSDAGRCKEIA